MAEFLLELLSEEIPARMQARAAEDLKRLVTDGLKEARLGFGRAEAFVTPRRLALVVDELPDRQPDLEEERKGPRVGAPDKAIQGFLGSVGLESTDQCEIRKIKGSEFYFAVREAPGRATAEILAELAESALRGLPWPKSMRWGALSARYVRPLHGILAILDGKPLSGAFDLGNGVSLPFGDSSCGHRFMAPEPFSVTSFEDYRNKLRAAHVMLDREERKAAIAEGAGALAGAENLSVVQDPALLDEVAGLVEWPVPLMGRIDDRFMGLPPEVLSTAMRAHQKYFALRDADGGLAPRFVVIANIQAADGGAAVAAGNERVLRARLADARFFWDQDRRNSLASMAPALKNVVFHAKLGTLDEKVDRLQALAADLAGRIPGADRDKTRSAARLCKADLVSEMVGEFPELQGLMGRYYALADGEAEEVAGAIRDHYSPLGPGDACPTAPVSVAVALADKIDTLVGFWAIGETPTGSKDPYALRRAALGVIRLILENGLRLGLSDIFHKAAHLHAETAGQVRGEVVADGLLEFFADRLKVHLREQGVRHDLVAAVFALGGEDDLVRLLARVEALAAFLAAEDGANLLTAYRRAANIVGIEAKKEGAALEGAPDPALYAEAQEKALGAALDEAAGAFETAFADEDFAASMTAMARLRAPVDAFFEGVTVNSDDPALRANRLRLLSRIGDTLGRVADFSRIEG
ncbi:MAG: glycine--tRNA ligase subunit beta [Rhodospirillaceae bacterium]|jgi:glycyl-tRNA synthetase beta chain|nr:glycine--tRNA ligase subunit beta [Rhodospirillaceae bacterium]MBT6118549.1 glycine--tRNA ligase subunit beta [Rhodospirillaceae bacterium]